MTQPSTRPLRLRVQARVMNVANVPIRSLLSLPFDTPLSRRLMLVHIIGRRTGRRYRQPVSYVRDGDALLTPGGGQWKLNLRADQPVRIRLRGRDVWARPELIDDPGEVTRLFAVMSAANPALARFVPIPHDADGNLDAESLRTALRYGFRIVRWNLVPEPATPAAPPA
jgi:deazaflavin-dependent oxidoreductase (nitroreductase family)